MDAGLKDHYRRPKEPLITQQAKAWVLTIACTKPTDRGLAAELWTLSALARYIREHAPAAGHVCLAQPGEATIWRILHAGEIKPGGGSVFVSSPAPWRATRSSGR